jgi:hypothetical protein
MIGGVADDLAEMGFKIEAIILGGFILAVDRKCTKMICNQDHVRQLG